MISDFLVDDDQWLVVDDQWLPCRWWSVTSLSMMIN